MQRRAAPLRGVEQLISPLSRRLPRNRRPADPAVRRARALALGPAEQAIFDTLKRCLTNAPIRTFDSKWCTVVATNASEVAITAVLTQPDDDSYPWAGSLSGRRARSRGPAGGPGVSRQYVSELLLESCNGRVILPLQGDCVVDEAQRREVEVRTVVEERGAFHDARKRSGGARPARR